MAMAAKPAIEAMAAWQQPLAEVSATIAAQQKLCAQMARATKLTAMQEMLQHIHNFTIPAVQVTTPKIDEALSAINYMEENQPELCQQVEDALAIQATPDDSADNIKAYMLFCTEIIIGLEGVREVAVDPAIKAGCVSLIVIFSSLLAYLKYCKEEQ
jgi:uncharacterized coiled-coil protein SlyX